MSTDTEFGPPLRGGPNYKESDGYGPAETSRRRLLGRGRGLALLAVLVLALVLIPLSLLLVANARIDKTPVDRLASGGAPLNVLVVGSDSREDLSPEERAELTTGTAEGERADSLMLVSMQGNDTAILAFPRDLYVTRCDGRQGRINAASAVGPSCLVDTVADLSGIPIHHYMETRFGGFRDVVDALGGVEMCLDEPIRDASAGIDLPSGCQQLGGADALGYVRVRNIDNDFGRIERQQSFLQALASEVVEPTNILNLPKMFRVANAGGKALRASDSVGPISLARIGWGARGLASGAPAHTVPGTPATIGGAAVLQLDEARAQPLFDAFRTGAALEEASGSPDVADASGPPHEAVSVTVLNGANVDGLGATIGDELEARGYEVATVGNTDPTPRTVLRYPAGQDDAAARLAADAPGDVPTEQADVSSLTLVLGADLR